MDCPKELVPIEIRSLTSVCLFVFYCSILIYSVSSEQQSDSVIYACLFSFRFFSIIGYYKILNIVPCAKQ